MSFLSKIICFRVNPTEESFTVGVGLFTVFWLLIGETWDSSEANLYDTLYIEFQIWNVGFSFSVNRYAR